MKSYKEMNQELTELVESLQNDVTDIDMAILKYKQAEKLILKIEAYLDESKNKFDEIKIILPD